MIFHISSVGRLKLICLEKIVLFVTSLKPRNLCVEIYGRNWEVFPLSVMNFIVSNLPHFQVNSSEDIDNTRNKCYLHRPPANLRVLRQVHALLTSKSFKSLPPSLKIMTNKREDFEVALKWNLKSTLGSVSQQYVLFVDCALRLSGTLTLSHGPS